MTAEELAAKDAVDLQKKQEDAVREAADSRRGGAERQDTGADHHASREFRDFGTVQKRLRRRT